MALRWSPFRFDTEALALFHNLAIISQSFVLAVWPGA